MSFRVEEIEKNIRNLNTKLCCIQKQIEQGATLEGENAIVYVGAEGVLQTSVDNLRYSETGLFIKGIDTQNVLTINNHLDASLLTLTNSGILTFGVNELNLLTDLSVQNDLLYFDTINDRIGIGTSTPEATLSIRSQGTSNRRGILVEHSDNITAFSQSKFIGARSRGSHGSPSAVLNNDSLVSFNAVGYKATGWSDTLGGMYVYAGGNFTDVSTPTYITFRGVASGTTVSEWARLNSTGLGIMVTPTATLHAKGNSDSVGNIFVAENLSNTTNLTIGNNGILTHTFTNTDYSAIDTGYSIQFKRTANTGLRLGTVATFTTNYNSSSNVSILQAQHNNSASVLKINPYGGAVHIGSINNNVILGNITENINSTTSVIACGGDTSYSTANFIVNARASTTEGLRFWGSGNDGSYFNSMIRGVSDNILFRRQLIQIGYSSPYAFESTLSTNARLEINVGHRTMIDSSNANQGNTYYQRFSWHKGSAAADRYSYMMIGSNALSTMGMQMKVSGDAVTFANGNITLNPFGGNVGVGIATAPTASLHVKGSSDSVGSSFRVENLSNTSYLNFANNGAITHNAASFTTYNDAAYIVTFQNSYNGFTGIRLSAAGNLHFFTGGPERVGKIGKKGANSAGKLWYFAGFNGGGNAGDAGHLFEADSAGAVGNATVGVVSQFMQLNPVGGTGIGTAVNSFKFLDIKTSSAINLDNPNTTIFGIDYNPTITSYNGAHYGLLVRPNTLNGFGLTSNLPTAVIDLADSTTARASLRIRSGVAPTTPNDGDIWNDGTDLKVRLGGTTYTLVKV